MQNNANRLASTDLYSPSLLTAKPEIQLDKPTLNLNPPQQQRRISMLQTNDSCDTLFVVIRYNFPSLLAKLS